MKMNKNKQRLAGLVFAFFIITLSGCVFLDRYRKTGLSNDLSQPTFESSLFIGIDGVDCIPDTTDFETANLVDIIDGDSIKVEINGELFQVRYIGIDTPEYYSDQRADAIEAAQANENLLASGIIYLFSDQSNTDKFDRLLRYVVSNGKFVNLELVRSGHARSKWYKPDVSCQPTFDLAVRN